MEMDGREARLREELHREDAEISRLKEELRRCQQEGVGQVSRRLYIITCTDHLHIILYFLGTS